MSVYTSIRFSGMCRLNVKEHQEAALSSCDSLDYTFGIKWTAEIIIYFISIINAVWGKISIFLIVLAEYVKSVEQLIS